MSAVSSSTSGSTPSAVTSQNASASSSVSVLSTSGATAQSGEIAQKSAQEFNVSSSSSSTAAQVIQAEVIAKLSQESQYIRDILGTKPFVIDTTKAQQLTKLLGNDTDKLLRYLVPFARPFARPPISNYHVGAAAMGKSGTIYLGVNLEFVGFPLNAAVHGEQFLLANARSHGETELTAIAVSAAPCGHCRQFLNEIEAADALKIMFQTSKSGKKATDVSTNLARLLPESFGPQDLGIKGGLLTPVAFPKSTNRDPLTAKAIDAAHASYAPYTKILSGVAIKTKDGKMYSGSSLENAAFNPSLSPLQAALVCLVVDMRKYDEISEVVLAETQGTKASQVGSTQELLKSIAPGAQFRLEKL